VSQFEFVMAMMSLIMALALAQGLRGLSEIVVSRNRYSPHSLWVIAYILMIVLGWWSLWDFSGVAQWRLTIYLAALTLPAILYIGIHLLVPAARVSEVDWRTHFLRVRRHFFSLGVAMIIVAVWVNVEYFGTPVLHPYRLSQAVYLAIFIVGFCTENEKVQRTLPVLFIVSFVASLLVVRMNIGALIAN